MDLLKNYGSNSDEEEEPWAEVSMPENQNSSAGASPDKLLGQLPAEVLTMFNDSEYDLSVERRRADERAKDTQWTRRFPHERGNWPTFVFIPVPNSAEFVSMVEASVLDFRQNLAAAWTERYGSVGGRGKKRGRDSQPSSKHVQKGGTRKSHDEGPPEVVLNDMTPSAHQHLSLSKTVVLRAHHIDPFVQALKEAFTSSRRFTASVVSGYDVLVNEDKSRSFVCLRVRGGRHLVLQLIRKSDTIMDRFKQSGYYEDPVVHVSIASVAGDVSSYVGSSSDELRRTTDVGAGDSAQEDAKREDKCNDPDRDDSNSESEEDVAAPFEDGGSRNRTRPASRRDGKMHANGGMHDTGELGLSHEEPLDLRERQAFHRKIGKLDAECTELENETFEMEDIVETQGWDDEQALGEDMKEEREREEEIKRSEKEMKELLSQRRYRQRILNAEVDKLDKARRKLMSWGKDYHDSVVADADRERTRAKAHHDHEGEGVRNHRHSSTAGIIDRGAKGSRIPFGAPPPRRQSSAGTLYYKPGAEHKSSGKTPH